MNPRSIRWHPREPPLLVAAAVGIGASANELGQLLLLRSATALEVVVGDELLLVAGPTEQIPWVDGLIWLGRDPRAPELLMPTTLEPDVHPTLFAGAVGQPAAVLPNRGWLVPLGDLRPLWVPSLRRWMKRDP